MIHKKITFGKVENLTLIELGTGDVKMNAVASAGVPDRDTLLYSGVTFTNDEVHEIGAIHEGDVGKTTDDLQPQVMITFTKVESIDALLQTLQAARESLVGLLSA